MATTQNPLQKAMAARRESRSYPLVSMVRQSPQLAAVLSKLVSSQASHANYGVGGRKQIQNPDAFQMRQLSHRMGRNSSDSEMVLALLPDMKLSAEILVSSILSPKDMMSTEMNLMPPEGIFDPQITNELMVIQRRHFDQVYKIKPKLGKILRDVLFENGSHVRAVIPENSLDELIHRQSAVTMENLKDLLTDDGHIRPMGFLGPNKRGPSTLNPGLESLGLGYSFGAASTNVDSRVTLQGTFPVYEFQQAPDGETPRKDRVVLEALVDDHLRVTDNLSVLKMPKLAEKIRLDNIRGVLGVYGQRVTMESSAVHMSPIEEPAQQKISDRELADSIYRRAQVGHKPVVIVKTQEQLKRRTVGDPLILELPSESVIPVHVPGQEEKHIGYFVLLDQHGNPVSRKNQRDTYGELADRMSQGSGGNNQFASQLIQRVSSLVNGFDTTNNAHLDYSAKVYAEMVEADLLARLKNGVYTNGAALAKNEEVYRIMLARTLSAQQTQMLFLPVELVTYFAFDFTPDGTGKSLMEDMKILNSLSAMLMFSDVMASVRNSIGMTDVKVKLDDVDPDPYKTIERTTHELLRVKQQSFPLGVNSPVDLVNYLQRAAINVTWEGHPGLPDIGIEKSERSTNYPKPDDTLSENMRKRRIMATGLNPETVDTAFNGEFATSVVQNSVMLSRRVLQHQEKFCPLLAQHVRQVTFATEGLMLEMAQLVGKNFKVDEKELSELKMTYGENADVRTIAINRKLAEFINAVEVELPKPDMTRMENQLAQLNNFIQVLDPAIDAFLSEEFLTSNLTGQAGSIAGDFKKAVRAHFIRQYMADNNILPQLSKITSVDPDGKPEVEMWEDIEQHHETIIKVMAAFMKHVQPYRAAGDKVLETTAPSDGFQAGGFGGSSGGGSFGGDAGGGMGGGDFGSGGGDDFSMGMPGDTGGTGGGDGLGGDLDQETGTGDSAGEDTGDTTNDQGGAGKDGLANPLAGEPTEGGPHKDDMPMSDLDDDGNPKKKDENKDKKDDTSGGSSFL